MFKLSITESEIQEMKTLIEKQSDELLSSRIKIQELTSKIKDLEDLVRNTETQLVQVKDENFKLKGKCFDLIFYHLIYIFFNSNLFFYYYLNNKFNLKIH